MSRRARRYAEATAAKLVALAPDPDDCCEHGTEWGDDCPECEAEVMEMLRSDGEPAQERRTQ